MRLDQESIGKISAFIAQNVLGSPVIVREAGDRIRINDILVYKHNGHWVVTRKGIKINDFAFRSWAVAYAVAFANNNASVNRYLEFNDKKLVKLREDKDLYKYHMNQAIKRGDDTKACIIEGRLSRTDQEISELVDEAQQVLVYQRIA